MVGNENMLVLVTGGAGFVGKHLINGLLREGYRVRSLDVKKPDIKHVNFESVEGSFINRDVVRLALKNVNFVFHLASTTIPKTSNEDPEFDISTNLVGSVSLLDESIKCGIEKFVFVSSGGTVYGMPSYLPVDELHQTNPLCSYGITKLAIEKYILMYSRLSSLSTLIVRLSNPYGENQNPYSGQGVIAAFCNKALKGESLEIWGDGSVVRDYISISDVTCALLSCLNRNLLPAQVINIGSGVGCSVNDIIKTIESSLGRGVKRTYHSSRAFDIPEVCLDISKAKEILNWTPKVSLPEGIKNLLLSLD